MKVLLVSSQVTYTPNNYYELHKELLDKSEHHIHGLVFLKNLNMSVVKSTAGLFALGAYNVASSLAKNIMSLPLKKTEKLYKSKNKEVLYFNSMNEKAVIEYVKVNNIDLIVNMRTRCIYKKDILEAPNLGCINIHHGILPEYRGTLCDLYALSENRDAGFTIHEMNKKIDDGKILSIGVVSCKSKNQKNYMSHLRSASFVEAQTLAQLLDKIGKINKLPEGNLNSTDKAIYTKNPTRKKIKELKTKGLII